MPTDLCPPTGPAGQPTLRAGTAGAGLWLRKIDAGGCVPLPSLSVPGKQEEASVEVLMPVEVDRTSRPARLMVFNSLGSKTFSPSSTSDLLDDIEQMA